MTEISCYSIMARREGYTYPGALIERGKEYPEQESRKVNVTPRA